MKKRDRMAVRRQEKAQPTAFPVHRFKFIERKGLVWMNGCT